MSAKIQNTCRSKSISVVTQKNKWVNSCLAANKFFACGSFILGRVRGIFLALPFRDSCQTLAALSIQARLAEEAAELSK